MDSAKTKIQMKSSTRLAHPNCTRRTASRSRASDVRARCGKTHLPATAGESAAGFIASASTMCSTCGWNSERNLNQLFEQPAQSPCVLFFDEVDALAAAARYAQSSARR